MSITSETVVLGRRFARELPELAVPWQAEPAPEPRLLALDEGLAGELGLDPAWLRSPDGLRLLTGEQVPDGATPVAQAYSGHQFGGFSPRLGDGRALLLGELTAVDGTLLDLHLKGSGRTPFARGGDGLAALGPMLREHLMACAMHALGIPTTRSLAVVATGGTVRRETRLPGAVLARVAASHLRVGTFQFARVSGDLDLLRRLVDHALDRHHPEVADSDTPALALLDAVVASQASLVARWMLVGFVHGVMNTDNMTISGQTIDYGPCAFLDAYDPAAVFSSIDTGGRYAFGNQPAVAQWDLTRLAETLLPLLADDEDEAVAVATASLERFGPRYHQARTDGMRAKLGLPPTVDDARVTALADELLGLLHAAGADLTSTFRALSEAARADTGEGVDRADLDGVEGVQDWLGRWRAAGPDPDAMDRVNPVYIPRNHLVEEALTAATDGDLAPFEAMLDVVARPYEVRPDLERYAAPAPADAARHVTYCGT